MTYLSLKLILRSSALVCASMLLIACGGGVTGDANNFVVVDDQTVVELNQITLSKATVDRTVCVVIYEMDQITSGVGTTVIGEKTLNQGDYENIVMPLLRESKDNESMFAELHEGSCASDSEVDVTSDVVITQNTVSAVQFAVTRSTVPFVKISSQIVLNESLKVLKVVANKPSWIVVHRFDESVDNRLGEIVGHEFVEPGHVNEVSILLRMFSKGSGVRNPDELIVALYEDNDQISNDDFDETVDVLLDATLSTKIEINVTKSCEDCIRFSLESRGTWAYDWDGDTVARSKIEQNDSVNETITLTVGETYEINNPAVAYDPLELINVETQEVLLSQKSGTEGIFEDDLEVNWSDNYGVITFTLTQDLADQLSKYRCAIHSSMAGNIVIADE